MNDSLYNLVNLLGEYKRQKYEEKAMTFGGN
jgi:hypothetical protein